MSAASRPIIIASSWLSAFMAAIDSSVSLSSMLSATTAMSGAAAAASFMCGNSLMHGPHQLAQKFSITAFFSASSL